MIREDQLDRIIGAFDAHGGIDCLWLFGSEAANTARGDSDVDLAVLFPRRPSADRFLDLVGEIGAVLGRDVDVVDLDRASPVIAMQVLRNGRLLVDRQPRRRIAFVSSLAGRYQDVMRMRQEVERRLIDKVCDG